MRNAGFLILPLFMTVSFGCSSPEADGPMSEITFEGISSQRISPTTTESIQEFNVTAYYPEGYGFITLLDRVTVKRTGPNKWSYSPAVKWPDAPVNFLAVSPPDNKIVINYWWRNVIQDYVCKGNEDLLVATRFGAHQGEGNIRLNFRHTLARVQVNLFTRNTDSRIKLHRVYLKDIPAQGNYYLPVETTEPLKPDGTSNVNGEWDTFNKSSVTYTLFKDDTDSVVTDELMLVNRDLCFFLPCKLDPLQHSGYYHGSRIEVVYQVLDKNTGQLIWPSTETPAQDIYEDDHHYAVARYALIDGLADESWQQGWSYNYTAELIPGNSLILQKTPMTLSIRKY